MKIIKDMKVGDIYLNPLIQDLWILRKEYIEDLENDNEKWVLALINDDYTEDFEAVANFVKVGNIYELLQENIQLKENNMSMQEEMARTWEKADLYKEVVEEVREYVEKTPIRSILEVHCGDEEEYTKPLLQILDKVKEVK